MCRGNPPSEPNTFSMQSPLSSAPQPGKIKRLPQDVVNRIAAGEVVLRPSAAVKELLENCLDAGAKNITVTTRAGGMKLLRIVDDGSGISEADLPLLCQRFATSKLRKFDDLRTVSTFGFRGEALASISHVSRLSVLTKLEDARVGYSASYLDGKLQDLPRPRVASVGTTLIVEDLFYNLPTRRNALRTTGEEYRAIVDVVSRYAIRYPSTSFTCKQINEKATANNRLDVRTRREATSTDNIRAAFGSHVSQEIISVAAQIEEKGVSIDSLVTKSSFNLKKRIFVLFINGRLVECSPLKRGIDAAYSEFLPKGTHPFTYVNIVMNQEDIDVNVHPTKKEVRFLYEAEIIEAYTKALLAELRKSETSRTFLAQSVLGPKEKGASLLSIMKPVGTGEENNTGPLDQIVVSARPSSQRPRPSDLTKTLAPQHVVRTGPSQNTGNLDSLLTIDGQKSPAAGLTKWRKRRHEADPLLSSIQYAINDMHNNREKKLAEIFKEHTFVGVASDDHALIQYRTSILLVEIAPVVRELMLRQVLMRFADLDELRFDPPVQLSRLSQADMTEIVERKGMFKDYFQIELVERDDGQVYLATMPLIFQGIMPNMKYAGNFFTGVATEVDWTEEAPCLLGIASRLADLYGYKWLPLDTGTGGEGNTNKTHITSNSKNERRQWLLQHVLFASLRADYDPPKSFHDENVVREITNTSKLYKVFERC